METSNAPDGRLAAFGNQLIEVHISLREQLAELRQDLDAYLEDDVEGSTVGRRERPRDLRSHCLTFCSAVSRHHTGEDQEAFPALGRQFPELRPVLEELERDHQAVAGIMRRLDGLFDGLDADPATEPGRVSRSRAGHIRSEVDGLAALLESHFGYEEKRLVAALNVFSAENPTLLRRSALGR